jgi:hypothetical protein
MENSISEVVNPVGTTDAFGNHYILGRVIKDFPYARRRCPYCEFKLVLANAVHRSDAPEHYKAVLICGNINCSVYDLDAQKCYAKIYYSSESASYIFYNVKFPVKRFEQEELYTIYQ